MIDLAKNAGIKIKQLRTEKNMTQTELANKLKIGKSAISNYEAGYRMPKQDLLFALSNIFNVDVDYFFPSDEDKKQSNYSATLSLVTSTTAKLEEPRQENVLSYAEQQLKEQNNENNITSLDDYRKQRESANQALVEFSQEPKKEVNIAAKTSAGYGITNYCKDQILKVVTMNISEIPLSYDLAFEICGDSMFPFYHDGDIVFVKYDSNVYNRSIMIVEINGEAFLKKLFVENNQLRLVSLNDDTDENGNPLYPDIIAGEEDEIYIIGKVVN